MESIIIVATACLTIIILSIINRGVNLRKIEALEKLQELLITNADKIDDSSSTCTVVEIIDSIEHALHFYR